MFFQETPLAGAVVIELEQLEDERGFFARSFCAAEFEKRGLNPCISQSSISFSRRRGTLRGLHFQAPPHAETRLVRCTRGSAFDVIVDLRPDSATLYQWFGAEISADNRQQIYVPEGFAHGFQTLEDNTELLYDISVPYSAASSRGFHWASPAFEIRWPMPPTVISARDAALESLENRSSG